MQITRPLPTYQENLGVAEVHCHPAVDVVADVKERPHVVAKGGSDNALQSRSIRANELKLGDLTLERLSILRLVMQSGCGCVSAGDETYQRHCHVVIRIYDHG